MYPLSQAVPGALADLLHAAPLSPGKMSFAWRAAVGAAIGRVTSVRLDGRALVVEAASAEWACEVARSSEVILRRLRMLLGAESVTSLQVRTP